MYYFLVILMGENLIFSEENAFNIGFYVGWKVDKNLLSRNTRGKISNHSPNPIKITCGCSDSFVFRCSCNCYLRLISDWLVITMIFIFRKGAFWVGVWSWYSHRNKTVKEFSLKRLKALHAYVPRALHLDSSLQLKRWYT